MPKISRHESLKRGGQVVAAIPSHPGDVMPGNEPDAELLRLNAEYRTFLREIKDGQHRDAKGDLPDETVIHMCALERKIAAMPADTYAGISIKLRIGVENLAPIDPGMTRDSIDLNLESALADAERLAGRAS